MHLPAEILENVDSREGDDGFTKTGLLSPLGMTYLLESLLDEAAVLVDEGAKLHVEMPEEYFFDEDE